ncbi:MAG: inositol monophosphatase [Candidatus Woesearchaeota archaeon]
MDEKKFARDLKKITVIAGKKVMTYFGKAEIRYTKKSFADIVTQADLASSNIIIKFIKKKYPNHGIISEEEKDYQDTAEYVWIIDPLDGTRNFSRNNTNFSVMIAIFKNKKALLSAIYNPFFKELYFAQEGKGALLNNKKISCSPVTDFNRSIAGFDVCVREKNLQKNAREVLKLLHAQTEFDYWITHEGCAGFTATLIANGQRDWFCQPVYGGVWDLAAPYLVLKESGCIVTNFSGKEWSITDTEMLAANPILHKQLLKILNS